jgi:short subunit fatty acids transporter
VDVGFVFSLCMLGLGLVMGGLVGTVLEVHSHGVHSRSSIAQRRPCLMLVLEYDLEYGKLRSFACFDSSVSEVSVSFFPQIGNTGWAVSVSDNLYGILWRVSRVPR